jgi:hypothetical protein
LAASYGPTSLALELSTMSVRPRSSDLSHTVQYLCSCRDEIHPGYQGSLPIYLDIMLDQDKCSSSPNSATLSRIALLFPPRLPLRTLLVPLRPSIPDPLVSTPSISHCLPAKSMLTYSFTISYILSRLFSSRSRLCLCDFIGARAWVFS